MLLNRVLCVTGLYFSPFNDGLIVCVRACVCMFDGQAARLISLAGCTCKGIYTFFLTVEILPEFTQREPTCASYNNVV